MAQFSMIPERRKILEKFPDYAVTSEPAGGRVTITCHGTQLASSCAALLVRESKHANVYYLPREDVDLSLFSRTDHSTYCPFKGHASYWSLNLPDHSEDNVVWSYEGPYPEVSELKDYLSFYSSQVEVNFEPD